MPKRKGEFAAGLEMTFAEFRNVGLISFVVSGFGVAVPFFSAVYAILFLGYSYRIALIVGAALSATRIAITSKVLESFGKSYPPTLHFPSLTQ